MTRTDAERVIVRELEPGEQLLWTGVPKSGLLLRTGDALLIPFSLLWGALAIFWEVGAWTGRDSVWASIWGIPFVLVGLYLVGGRFFVDAYQRGATAYGLTTKRAIIVSDLFVHSVTSIELRTLTDVTLSERKDGYGSIVFGTRPSAQGGPSFELIETARAVHTQLRAAQTAG